MLGNPYIIGLTKQFFGYFGIDNSQAIGVLLTVGMFMAVIIVAVVGMSLCRIFINGNVMEDSEYDD